MMRDGGGDGWISACHTAVDVAGSGLEAEEQMKQP